MGAGTEDEEEEEEEEHEDEQEVEEETRVEVEACCEQLVIDDLPFESGFMSRHVTRTLSASLWVFVSALLSVIV